MPTFCKVCGDIMKGPKCKCGAVGLAQSGNADTFADDGLGPVSTQYTDAYVSSGLMAGLDDGLRRMANVRPEWIDKSCVKCGKVCAEGAVAPPTGPDRDKPYCQPCFDKTYGKGECGNCHDTVYVYDQTTNFVKGQDGKVYHDVCYNQERRCYVCRKPIFGGAVNAMGRDYCEGCFQCGGCQQPFQGGSFFEFHGAPYCRNCIDDAKKSGGKTYTRTVPKDEEKTTSLNAKVKERQGELGDLQKFKHVAIGDTCSKCRLEIISNAITLGNGLLFHPDCFVCASCSKGFPDMTFAEKDGAVYHGNCLNTITAPKCFACKLALKGKQVEYEGKKYHVECFKCGSCSRSLAGVPFGEQNGKNVCEGCLNSSSKVAHGDYRPGFTVNPTSFNKEERGVGGAKLGAKPGGFGAGNECPLCGKAVFMTEQVQGPFGKNWHRGCLRCGLCSKQLDSMAQIKDDRPYCRDCSKKV